LYLSYLQNKSDSVYPVYYVYSFYPVCTTIAPDLHQERQHRLYERRSKVEILRQGQADNCLLINLTEIKSTLRPIEEFHFAEKLVATDELRDARLAILQKPGGDENRLLHITATNRGLTLKEFTDRNEAIRWLHE